MTSNAPQNTSRNTAELEAIIARNALKYDLLPYASNPFPQSVPARLAALAQLFGLAPQGIETARVLELGCAAGGNIIPLAQRYPEARFVGVDLSRTQVAAGRARIANLGLNNIEILCQSFTELQDTIGTFDYIVCHGVYSWVPAPVREAVLRICKARLAPEGIAYISYNVLPGWRMMQAMRDAFQITVPDQIDSRARVGQALNVLEMLQDLAPKGGAYGEILRSWYPRLKNLPEDYVAHEFLEEVNEPCTFADFVDRAAQAGLGYLADTDLSSMVLDNQPAAAAERIRAAVGNNLVATEQMLDMISGRTFRQTLLVHAEKAAGIDRNLTHERVRPLHFTAAPDLKVVSAENGGTLSDGTGRSLTTNSPQVVQALSRIVARFPASTSVEDMLGALSVSEREAQGGHVLDAVFRMVIAGLLTPLTAPVAAEPVAGDKPLACALARADAASGETGTANLRHERVIIDPAARAVLPAMDGTRDRAALAAHLAGEAKAGRITFSEGGQPVSDPAALDRLAEDVLVGVLEGVGRAALLVARG